MCGRYAASANPDELIEAFDVELDWGALFFTQDEWNEFVRLIEQVEG